MTTRKALPLSRLILGPVRRAPGDPAYEPGDNDTIQRMAYGAYEPADFGTIERIMAPGSSS